MDLKILCKCEHFHTFTTRLLRVVVLCENLVLLPNFHLKGQSKLFHQHSHQIVLINFSSASTKVGMNDLFEQIQLMRGDGKMADFDNKISAVRDNVSNPKSEITRTPSQDRGALYKSPPRRQLFW